MDSAVKTKTMFSCFSHFFSSLVSPVRLVRQHGRPELGGDIPPTNTDGTIDNPGDEARKQLDELRKGLHAPIPNVPRAPKKSPDVVQPPDSKKEKSAENPEDEKPIDPNNAEGMLAIRKELDRRKSLNYDRRISRAKADPEVEPRVRDIVKDLGPAMLYQAIIENWKTTDLYEEYTRRLQAFFDIAYSQNIWGETKDKFKRAFYWTTEQSTLGRTEDNPFIKGKIDQARRDQLIQEFMDIDTELDKEIIKDVSWFDSIDKDQLSFVQDQSLPFWKRFIVDKGVIWKWDEKKIRAEYEKKARNLLEQCVVD